MMDILNVGININNHSIIAGKPDKSFLGFNKNDIGNRFCSFKKSATVLLILVEITFKVNYREKAPSNKTPALTKSMNMETCVVGTTNQVFMRGS